MIEAATRDIVRRDSPARLASYRALRAIRLLAMVAVVAPQHLGGVACAGEQPEAIASSFERHVKPFLKQHCERCHNVENRTSGVRVDHLDSSLDDRHLKLWDHIRKQVDGEAMPPEEEKQPTEDERRRIREWISLGLEFAKSRPVPKNGSTRRLTVAQYRNTLRELLHLEDELTEVLPPDAVSRDGFVNNQETLALSPLLVDAYFDIARQALERSVVDPALKPAIQHFRVDLGAGINPNPCPDRLILGANNHLLKNRDFAVTQPNLSKPFGFTPVVMRTKYRFLEGYDGNNTVRGWREYDSIYHAVFACMRGSEGYPKGFAYDTVPQGLLLRPAITNDEIFEGDSTYGPKANFKISLRELPDRGRFRVTVTAAKYRDGLLLDQGAAARSSGSSNAVVFRATIQPTKVAIKEAGIYQIDLFPEEIERESVAVDATRLEDGLIGHWALDGTAETRPVIEPLAGKPSGDAKFVETPFGKGVLLDGAGDSVAVPRHDSMNIGDGAFTIAAWIHPDQLRQAGIVSRGKYNWTHGWYLDMPDDKGILRIETSGPDNQSSGTVQSEPGAIVANAWQHVAAVVGRGKDGTRLYVNGYLVGRGTVGSANLDNPRLGFQIGRIQDAHQFLGKIDEVRVYRRALDAAEIQALIEPGRKFARRPASETPQDVTLILGDREIKARWQQPAFVAIRLEPGEIPVEIKQTGRGPISRAVFTPLSQEDALAKRFVAFEKRSPRLGVHLGLRRDCGSTLNQVGEAQVVSKESLSSFVFEGAIRNFPSPEVEKDNVNYLAGLSEIGVRSEYTDGRDMPRLLVRSIEFEGPYFDAWPPASHREIFIESGRKEDPQAHARRVIRAFAGRAFRRPVTPEEEASLMAVFERAFKSGSNFQASVVDALTVVLTSPQFLLLIENSRTPDAEPLDDYELASKLSYFLWNGPPDQQLLKLAEAGSIRGRLDSETGRMIDDPRFSQFVDEFASQWLALEKFQVLEPDRNRFPKLNRAARVQLRREPLQFVQYLIRNNLPVRDLIDSEFIVANEAVASYYDLADRTETGFEFTAIKHGRRDLGGVLAQAAIMAGLSDGRESNPVKRGAWLARRIIAEPPDDPPPNVPALKDEKKGLTLRQRLEEHRNQRGCAQCHAKIDPWGVPFEVFDAGGRFKREAVDARSTLPDGAEIGGFDDLKRYLSDDRIDQVAFSVLKHLTTYATGRTLSQHELDFLKRDGLRLKPGGYRMRELIQYVVNSPMFLEK